MIQVLIIEDDEEFAGLVKGYLEGRGMRCTATHDPYAALVENLSTYDLVLLDLGLPGMDGLEVCKKFRAKSTIPIIISSARGSVADKVLGLQIGSDDYLPKPYDPDELYARIISLLRRTNGELADTKKLSDFRVDSNGVEVFYHNEPLDLSGAESEVLACLIKNLGHLVSREQLLGATPSILAQDGKSLDVVISKVRHKLKEHSGKNHIITTRGRGYRLVE